MELHLLFEKWNLCMIWILLLWFLHLYRMSLLMWIFNHLHQLLSLFHLLILFHPLILPSPFRHRNHFIIPSTPTPPSSKSIQFLPFRKSHSSSPSAVECNLSPSPPLQSETVVIPRTTLPVPTSPWWRSWRISLPTLSSRKNRIPFLRYILRRWSGRIVAVLALSPRNYQRYLKDADDVLRFSPPRRLKIVLYKYSESEPFPVNKLRNLAINNIETTHFFYNDIDFLPSRNPWMGMTERIPVWASHADSGVLPKHEQNCDYHTSIWILTETSCPKQLRASASRVYQQRPSQ